MWTAAEYQPTSLFSLRPYSATTSGGKSLLVPTPFAVKMALLDVAIRTQGLYQGKERFPAIRDLRIAVRLPRWLVVNNTFGRILRLKEVKAKASDKGAAVSSAIAERHWPFQKTIAFREYVHFGGPLVLAFHGLPWNEICPLLMQINYLGKRGGFFQLLGPPVASESLPETFTVLTEGVNGAFPVGTLQMVDDCGPALTFERADVYSSEKIRVGQDRIFHHVVLPLRLVRSSRGFSLYERM